MARQILVLRNEEQPCPFDDEGETAFTEEQIAAFLALDGTTSIVTCAHHEPITMQNMPPGYVYTPSVAGQVKGVMHAADEEPVVPDAPPHISPPGLPPEEAEAEAQAAAAAGEDMITGANVADLHDVIGPTG